MRAVRSTADGVRVVDVTPDASTGVRVRVASSSICGSDVHMVSFGPMPVTLGHEFCGRLDDGTPVAVHPRVTCGTCDRCLEGNDQQCTESVGGMYGVSLDGGLADEVWVDPSCAKVLPSEDLLEFGNLVEPIAVAVHGINRANVGPGGRALVIGAGPIGLCTIAALRAQGTDVDVIAHHEARLAAAERIGASVAAGVDYDVVLDAAGTQSSMDEAINRARPGATVGILGNFWSPIHVGLAFQMKELTLLPAFTYGHHEGVDEFEAAISVLHAAPELADTLVTHHFSLDDAPEAFAVTQDRTSGAIKVVLHP